MTNLDSLFLNRRKMGAGSTAPPPVRGAARFFYLAFTHFAKLVGLNMLFLLFCVPVVTIPAALCGMNRVCILLVREGTASVWSDFITEFRSSFVKSLPPGLLCAFLGADAALCGFLGMTANAAGLMPMLFIAAGVLLIAALLLGCGIFVLMPLVELKNGDILRDALFLIMKEPKADLLLTVLVGGGLAALILTMPYSAPVVAVIGPAFLSLAACTILHEPIRQHILEPGNAGSSPAH